MWLTKTVDGLVAGPGDFVGSDLATAVLLEAWLYEVEVGIRKLIVGFVCCLINVEDCADITVAARSGLVEPMRTLSLLTDEQSRRATNQIQ